ncbi:MAG: MBL fold metallo-hydrolase [Clostridia bacterium]|nr:MBL fold metallo-hydrolase [Clostridia bacterium]
MAELKIGRMVMGPVGTNCYFVYNENKEAIVFDPPTGGKELFERLTSNGLTIEAILLTHGHFDHIMGVNELRKCAGVKVYACEEEQEVCESSEMNCSDQIGRPYVTQADVYVRDEEEIQIKDMKCRLLHTPGHTKGSCCYYFYEDGLLISGDTLFAGSVGRTDLPTGSMGTLERSISQKLSKLPDDTKVYPGHGDQTTIEFERKHNPFWKTE